MKKIITLMFAAATIVACNTQQNPAHGEQGHTCTEACSSMMKPNEKMENVVSTPNENVSENELKDHVCTAECKAGECVYAHGEKGHVCSPSGCK